MDDLDIKNGNWWWRNILGGVIVAYIILIVFSPIFSKREQNSKTLFINRLETSDVVLISLCFLFNSGIVERLRKFQVSATEVSAELDAATKKVESAQSKVESAQEIMNKLSSDSLVISNQKDANNNFEKLNKGLREVGKELILSSEKIQHIKKICK